MDKKTVRDVHLDGKTVLHHVDFNIKLKQNPQGELVPISDVRIKTYFQSIFYLLNRGCKVVFMSWLERPEGKVVEKLRLEPIAKRLSRLINRRVIALDDCIGVKVRRFIDSMNPGEMVMLENTRFHDGEMKDNDRFARALSKNADLMVQDAFGHCHRVHASVTGVPRHIPAVAGLYLDSEVKNFDRLMGVPENPFILIIGGTKIYDKIKATRSLINRADQVLIGGAVANNFLKAKGLEVGRSFMAEPYVDKAKGETIDAVQVAKELMTDYGNKVVVPLDMVAADKIKNPSKRKVIDFKKGQKLNSKWAFLDIGPKTIKKYQKIIKNAKTVFWDGPMGKYEDPEFRDGTLRVAEAVAENPHTTVLAGGDTAALAEDFGLIFRYSHVSIAGGAALAYLSGKKLPGIVALEDR